jgi:RNA polymerase sigma factor (sigma-70 family)
LKMMDSRQVFAEYARSGSDGLFRELVTRYVDLVYSTALRLVGGDAHLAEDVAQTVFLDLARQAKTLSPKVMLGGWLHRHTCFVVANTLRGERRRQLRERRAAEMNALQNEPEADFSQVAPLLDAAINELGEADRTAIVLRFFEQRDFRSVGQALGSHEDAARMRVTRALEKLEILLKRRGVTTTSTLLATTLLANAVQAAPVGLTLTITTALTAVAGATVTAATATKTIIMTTLQKSIVGVALTAAVGTGVYEARQASRYQAQMETLQQQQAPLAEQVRQLQKERDDATQQLIVMQDEIQRLGGNTTELLRLRNEVTRLQGTTTESANQGPGRPVAASQQRITGGDPAQLTQEGLALWQSGRPGDAIAKFEAAVKLDPGNSIAWNGLGWASFNTGNAAEGERAFQKVIELEPEHPAALNGLGQINLAQKKYTEAEGYLLKAGPKAPAAWYGLTRLYLLQGKFEQAEQWAQTIVDSGQADETARAMLKAAKEKRVSDGLRLMIEPQ